MSKIKTMIKLLSNPNGFAIACFNNIVHTGVFDRLNSETFLKMRYYIIHHKRLNLDSPETFTEKLQWLKLFYLKAEFTDMVDKYAVKKLVSSVIGKDFIIPTLGVWDDFDDIDIETLPDKFVLKTSHGGGGSGVVICKDKKNFDWKKAQRTLQKSMKVDIYKVLREWPYKNVRKRIITRVRDKKGH